MSKVTISVPKFYGDSSYYDVMPRPVFDALEAAFIEGRETAEVPAEDYNTMLSAYARK